MNNCCGSGKRDRSIEEIIFQTLHFAARDHLHIRGITLTPEDFEELKKDFDVRLNEGKWTKTDQIFYHSSVGRIIISKSKELNSELLTDPK